MEEYLQSLPQWQDEQQVRSLFSPFSQPRHVNPEAWDARQNFWCNCICDCLRRGLLGQSCFTIPSKNLPTLFKRGSTVPLGLETVVSCMQKDGVLVRRDYLIPSQSWWQGFSRLWRFRSEEDGAAA